MGNMYWKNFLLDNLGPEKTQLQFYFTARFKKKKYDRIVFPLFQVHGTTSGNGLLQVQVQLNKQVSQP